MIETFLALLTPMLTLFLYMALGFTLIKTKILPENSSKVLAKLLTFLFCPALSFMSMAKNFTINNLGTYASLVVFSSISIIIAILLALFLASLFVKDKHAYERNIYKYALAFGNYGYVGAPLVIAAFGMEGYAFFNFVTLPCSIVIYTWGISTLVPKTELKRSFKDVVKSILNIPTIGLLIGIVVGITGLGEILFTNSSLKFLADPITALANFMAPGAMILAGITVAKFDFKKMVSSKKVYVATIIRLIVLPAVILSIMYGVITIVKLIGINVDYTFLFLGFFLFATPLGMNTIVFPEAYGGDPKPGASLTLVSHLACVITIPIMFALLSTVLGFYPSFI